MLSSRRVFSVAVFGTATRTLDSEVLLLNTGNVHIRPHGYLQILDSKNEVLANIEIEGPPAFPGQPRNYTGRRLQDFLLEPGTYTASISVRDRDRIEIYDTERLEKIGELPSQKPSGIFFTPRAGRIGM